MLDAKLVFETILRGYNEKEHLAEWRKVSRMKLCNEDWDALVIGLCAKGKLEAGKGALTSEELNYLINMMLPECHN